MYMWMHWYLEIFIHRKFNIYWNRSFGRQLGKDSIVVYQVYVHVFVWELSLLLCLCCELWTTKIEKGQYNYFATISFRKAVN